MTILRMWWSVWIWLIIRGPKRSSKDASTPLLFYLFFLFFSFKAEITRDATLGWTVFWWILCQLLLMTAWRRFRGKKFFWWPCNFHFIDELVLFDPFAIVFASQPPVKRALRIWLCAEHSIISLFGLRFSNQTDIDQNKCPKSLFNDLPIRA